ITLASFFNVTKYPPALDYLLITLGPALLALALFDRMQRGSGRIASKVLVFGRVPMFYYLCHLYVVHLVALALATLYHQPAQQLGWNGGGFVFGFVLLGFGFFLLLF